MDERGFGTGMQITILQNTGAASSAVPLASSLASLSRGAQLIRLPGVRQAAEQHRQPVILEEVDLLARRLAHTRRKVSRAVW